MIGDRLQTISIYTSFHNELTKYIQLAQNNRTQFNNNNFTDENRSFQRMNNRHNYVF